MKKQLIGFQISSFVALYFLWGPELCKRESDKSPSTIALPILHVPLSHPRPRGWHSDPALPLPRWETEGVYLW